MSTHLVAPLLQRLTQALRRRLWSGLGMALLLSACAAPPAKPPAPNVGARPASPGSVAPGSIANAGGRAPLLPQGQLSAIGPSDLAVAGAQVASLDAPNDMWERIRRGFAMPDLDNDLVREREQWYTSRPDYIVRMTERSSKYLFHIVEEIERRGMPMELALLPYIESAFNPQAVSTAKAAGMWQFMPATGQSFDLKQNIFRDDRRDVLASTRAALDYLQQLHRRFGDWHLALAAYNWGQGNVNRALTRNTQSGLGTGYSDLSMPLETRQYVPKLQAVKNIVARPQAYGVRLPNIGNYPFFDTVTLERDIDVALIARLAGVSEADFRQLNPSLNKPMVMVAATPEVLLPRENAIAFLAQLRRYQGPLASWTAWVVPSTMTVAQAAEKAGMPADELRRLNNIPKGMLVRGGSSLLVERNGHRDADVSEHVVNNAQISLAPEIVLKRTLVKARKGETVASLAKRYGVSAAQVANWNALSAKAPLKSGQRLTLMLPQRAGATLVASAKAGPGREEAARPDRAGAKADRRAARDDDERPRGKGGKNGKADKATGKADKRAPATTVAANKGKAARAKTDRAVTPAKPGKAERVADARRKN